MADYRTRENADPALAALDAAARGDVRWMALSLVLRVIVGLLIEGRGYSPLPIARLDEPNGDD